MKVKLNVNEKCIANGQPQDGSSCPIALALHEAVPEAKYIDVDGQVATFKLEDGWYRKYLPIMAEEFIANFDARKDVEPFEAEWEFELDDER